MFLWPLAFQIAQDLADCDVEVSRSGRVSTWHEPPLTNFHMLISMESYFICSMIHGIRSRPPMKMWLVLGFLGFPCDTTGISWWILRFLGCLSNWEIRNHLEASHQICPTTLAKKRAGKIGCAQLFYDTAGPIWPWNDLRVTGVSNTKKNKTKPQKSAIALRLRHFCYLIVGSEPNDHREAVRNGPTRIGTLRSNQGCGHQKRAFTTTPPTSIWKRGFFTTPSGSVELSNSQSRQLLVDTKSRSRSGHSVRTAWLWQFLGRQFPISIWIHIHMTPCWLSGNCLEKIRNLGFSSPFYKR